MPQSILLINHSPNASNQPLFPPFCLLSTASLHPSYYLHHHTRPPCALLYNLGSSVRILYKASCPSLITPPANQPPILCGPLS